MKSARQPKAASVSLTEVGVPLISGVSPFPPRLTCKMPWSYMTGLTTPATNTTGIITYRLNSPYDPDAGAGGDQPKGYDQYAAIYGRYRVVRAFVELEFSNPNGDKYFGGYRVRRTGATNSSGLTWGQFITLPWSNLAPVSTAGTRKHTFRFSITPNEVYGMTHQQLLDDYEFSAANNNNATKEIDLDVVCYAPNATAVAANVGIKITYETVWSQTLFLIDS